MKTARACLVLLLLSLLSGRGAASAYNAQPKLVVVVILDQFRPDFLDRAHDQLGPNGFRLLTERGAYFPACYYDYASTETAPGHATLFTGAYSNGHGIAANQWWDATAKRMVGSVADPATRLLGVEGTGVSPHNLLSDTIGDELRLATDGSSRVFTVSLKDRAAVLPGGFSANGAFWIDHQSGAWVSSTFYMAQLPPWVQQFNASGKAEQYWNREWKDQRGNVLRKTTKETKPDFYETVGATPYGNDYELEFARELIIQEKLGQGATTDFLSVSLSAPDILGHKVGPNSPQYKAMVLALDHQLADFFAFLGQRLGLANVWIALSADHGIAASPVFARDFRIPAGNLDPHKLLPELNSAIVAQVKHPGAYVEGLDGTYIFVSQSEFTAAGISHEADAERLVGDALLKQGVHAYVTRAQLAAGNVPNDAAGRMLLHSYSTHGGWYVMALQPPYSILWGSANGTTHGSWNSYDRHVPLAFYGVPFQPGVYRGRCEPVDMVATLASLLGINPPGRAVGHVLIEAVRSREGGR